MRYSRWSIAALILLSVAALLAAGCGSGSGSGPLDLSRIPTATPPAQLPDPVIVGQSDAPIGGSGETYVVVSGDSPGSIAAQFGVSVEDLMAANGITDPTALQVGQELVIPGGARPRDSDVLGESESPTATPEPAVEAPEEPTAPVRAPDGEVYIVQSGDIPETIAAQFGITAEELMAANGITDPTSLQIGDELIIPAPSGE